MTTLGVELLHNFARNQATTFAASYAGEAIATAARTAMSVPLMRIPASRFPFRLMRPFHNYLRAAGCDPNQAFGWSLPPSLSARVSRVGGDDFHRHR